ncbi:insulinase family protein [Oscillatoriales cyanobacterium LEGE 11467]|uniref:Insulinase family protein n=1 Tax=Zarconia navalis LEGE 11467 TaxID=1828826 RepID=A0A928VVG1_9CYAN|nr:pitrilysin family protein [Zarconia navalis]MBE9041074.1 insulinase family protein [Zarconia navalis LEGE 11467]
MSSHFRVKRFRRDDGLAIVHQYLPATPVAIADVWVRAGALAEPDGWSGMAHFLEHAIFKGTDRLPPGAFDLEIENRGGTTNAATSHDYAHFFIATADRYFQETLPYLAEILLHASIPDDEFIRERDVVLEEIRQANDNPDGVAFDALMDTIYQVHPYKKPVLGAVGELLERSPQEMRSFHQAHYQPQNMTVVITGGIQEDLALESIEDCFRDFPSPPSCPTSRVEAEPPLDCVRRRELYLPRLELARLNMAWIGPGIDEIHDAYGLDLLAIVLAGGRSSRLVRQLREERQFVQWITGDFSLQRDSSLLTITAGLEPVYLNTVEEFVVRAVHQLQTTPISEVELARAKRQLCNDFAFSTETPAQLAGLYGYYQTLANAEIATLYPQRIQTFEPEELQQLARRYLRRDCYAITIAQGE